MIFGVVCLVFAVLSYIFRSVGLYTMAGRRGIRNPWLAWVPVADQWLLGCLSDQYQTLVRGSELAAGRPCRYFKLWSRC